MLCIEVIGAKIIVIDQRRLQSEALDKLRSGSERPTLGRTDVHKKGYTTKNRARRRKRPLTSLQKRDKLALDEHGLPIVTTLELKDEPLPFDAQVSRF